jgi:hypothetical protein
MKKLNWKTGLYSLLALVVILVILDVVSTGPSPWIWAQVKVSQWANSFETSYRYVFAYLSTIVLLLGLGLLGLRRWMGHYFPRWSIAPATASVPAAPPVKTWNFQPRVFIPLALLVIFIAWAPFIFRGQNTHVKIFDNLDCHVPQTKVLAESGKAFSLNPNTKLDQFLNGLALSGVDSGYNVMTWLFILLPPFAAFAVNELLMRLTAFLGMMVLLKTHVFKDRESYPWLWAGVSVCFSLLPFYPAGGLSVAGLPLLGYGFLNIRNRRGRWSDYLIIFIFPFYSKLALVGVFIAFTLTVIFLWDCWQQKTIHFPFLGGLALLSVTYGFTHFHLLYSFINPNFTSFREEIDVVGLSTGTALKNTLHNFLFDRINEVGAHHVFVLGAAALAILIALYKKITVKLLPLLIVTTICTSFLWGFKYWAYVMPLREKFQFINAFDLSRFYWFNPFLWYLIFALALAVIGTQIRWGKVIAAALILFQIVFMLVYYNWEYRFLLGRTNSFVGSPLTYSLSFKEFYSENLFAQIAQFIGKPKASYRVASIGIHPGISQYNGFYTLDIYTDIYSLEYKHRFREIFAQELDKNEDLKRGFDSNAKRCFIYVNELHGNPLIRGLAFTRGISKFEKNLKITHLSINTHAFKQLGGQYLFSAVEIVNAPENGLHLEKIFQNLESPWRIYLYKAI